MFSRLSCVPLRKSAAQSLRLVPFSVEHIFVLLLVWALQVLHFSLAYASDARPAPSAAPTSAASSAPHSAAQAQPQAADEIRISPTRAIVLPAFAILENVSSFAFQQGSSAKSGEKASKAQKPKETRFDHSRARYNVILALSTWSERARELGKFFQARLPELKTRKVAVVGVFTHDSYEDIARLAKEEGYTFDLSKTDLNYVEKLLNPKIPTIWVTDHRGQVVYRLVRPTSEGIAKVYEYLLAWTDF